MYKRQCTTRADVERSEGVTGPSPTVKKQSAKAEESVEESVTKAFEKRLQAVSYTHLLDYCTILLSGVQIDKDNGGVQR